MILSILVLISVVIGVFYISYFFNIAIGRALGNIFSQLFRK